jgi:hypothetical protein
MRPVKLKSLSTSTLNVGRMRGLGRRAATGQNFGRTA